jgi:DinB family
VKSLQKNQKNLSPINTEYTEVRRKEFYSANLGDFGEVRRIIFLALVATRVGRIQTIKISVNSNQELNPCPASKVLFRIGQSTLPSEPPATIAEMITIAENQHPEIVNGWRALDDAALQQKIPFVTPDGLVRRELSRETYLRVTLMHHVIHHRGQLTLMLRLMGAKVPSIYGPSGDEGWPAK